MRTILASGTDISEKKMFGGLAFLKDGRMIGGVQADTIVFKLGNEQVEKALKLKHTRPMDFTGKVIRSMVYVDPPGFRTKQQLEEWIRLALDAG